MTYYVTLTDSWGDGWDHIVLAFKQSGKVQTFTLSSGYEAGPTPFSFDKLVNVTIAVYVYDTWSDEVGFVVRNANGVIVFQRKPGNTFKPDEILGTFYPECVNLGLVMEAPEVK